jgi:hypothetical protein
MKSSEFKTLVREAVREAFQEELKDILLAAIQPVTPGIANKVRADDTSTNSLREQRELLTSSPKNQATSGNKPPVPVKSESSSILNDLLVETANSGTWKTAMAGTSDSYSAGPEVPLDFILNATRNGN